MSDVVVVSRSSNIHKGDRIVIEGQIRTWRFGFRFWKWRWNFSIQRQRIHTVIKTTSTVVTVK